MNINITRIKKKAKGLTKKILKFQNINRGNWFSVVINNKNFSLKNRILKISKKDSDKICDLKLQ